MTYFTIHEIKQANHDAGLHYFEPSTMRFFRSRVAPGVIAGHYFITSEQYDYDSPRFYTIRYAADDGSIDTVGAFQQYRTLDSARRAARKIAERCAHART